MRRALVILLAAACAIGCDSPVERAAPPPGAAIEVAANGRCVAHGAPATVCAKCNPALAAVFKAKGDWCDEHGFAESSCPVCNPDAEVPVAGQPPSADADGVGAIEGRVVRFRSPEIEKAAGIETTPAREAESGEEVKCAARLEFNANHVADIRAIVPGVVRTVRVELGAHVESGTPMFDLDSTQVGDIQATLRNARERVKAAEANLARQRELRARDISSVRQIELAEQELAVAQSQAQGATSTLRMAGAGGASGRYTLKAPIDGIVVRRSGVVGTLANDETSLATVADTSTMWALCAIPEAEAGRVRVGQTMVLEAGSETLATGEITWLAAEVDPRTRTVTARADVANPDGTLRANQFATAHVRIGGAKSAVLVPREAVQRVEGREVVFVRSEAGTYLPRVVVRHSDGPEVSVTGKIAPGDLVVTQGAVLLRTEVLPGSIGAGCCEVD